MSSNLDRSLDEILAARPRGSTAGRRGNRAAAAPVAGGVKKRSQRVAAQKATAQITQATTNKNSQKTPTGPKLSATKIIVSNLPFDVNENMIKEYFGSVVGPVKRATLTYGPDARSRGVATVEFTRSDHASTAAQKFNGVPVDNRPMKVELVVDANAPSLANRVGTPNNVAPPKKAADKPKPAAPRAARGGRGRTAGRGRGGASGSGRGKPKTAEQLDQEMADYFDNGSGAPAAPATAAAAAPAAAAADASNDMDVL